MFQKEKVNISVLATHTRTLGIIHPPPDIRTFVDKTAHFVAKNGPDFENRIIANNAGNFKPVRKVLVPLEPERYTVWLPEGITGEELDIIKLTAQFVACNGKSLLTGLTSINSPQFRFLKPTHSMFMFFTALADAYSKVLMPPKGLTEKLRNIVVDMTTVLERCLHRLEWERSQEQVRLKAEDEIEQERMQMATIDWHDLVVVEAIDFVDDEDEDLPPPMTLEEVIRRSKIKSMDEDVEPVEEADMEMDEEEVKLVEKGMSKRLEERIPAERDSTKFVVSLITGETIPIYEMAEHIRISLIDPKYKEQKERMMAKIRETTLAQDDEISRKHLSNAVKEEIEKKKEEQPKHVIWDGHTGSIGRTANQAMSQSPKDQIESGDNLPGPAAPPPKPGVLSVRPLPPPPGLALNMLRMGQNTMQYPSTGQFMQSRHPLMQVIPGPMTMNSAQQSIMMNRPPQLAQPVPPPPGSQYPPFGIPRPFTHLPPPPPSMHHGLPPPPPPPQEAPPPLSEEPEPKRQKVEDQRIPEEQFLAQHPGPVRIVVAIPNVDELNLRGRLSEITVQSLSETIGNLKEKIAAETQIVVNKQKLSGARDGGIDTWFDRLTRWFNNMSLAFCNIGDGESLTLALKERGGRNR
ncbi:hypothetical protein MKX01_003901 [Papaver californicum]|nr:hypothetical protein MKX01_003901 [Papaver californicum]